MKNNLVLLSLLIIALFGYKVFASEDKIQIYVSTTGDDSNSGAIARPYATFQAAKKALRNFRIKAPHLPVEIIIKGGTCYLDETLELGNGYSGSEEARVPWRAAENERVILSGGKLITGNW